MSLISMGFLMFVGIAVIGYYLIPRRFQWIWLLIFSYIYYASSGIKILFFLLFTTITTYGAGRLIEKVKKEKIKKRRVLVGCLLLNFGMLAVLKYTNFAIENVNAIFHTGISFQKLILPLGISFYTFQSMGYIIDVYWGKYEAEKNFFRFALFVSFFPQILQGPIGRFDRLAKQLYAEHSFNLQRAEYALQLILWGFFKKLVLADRAAVVVNQVFLNYTQYAGLTNIVAVLMYSIQLYMDFSGGMDVVAGVAGLFGIELEQNFKRPYFAVSITDFWHRWHITLGTWMKDYVFYPISLSKWMGKFGKWAKKVFGKKTGRVIPICVANVIVFLVVGIWHGAAWKFIAYGFYNGLIIAVSSLLTPVYKKCFEKLHLNPKSSGWRVVQIVRTFVLVNISWYFDMAVSLSAAWMMMKTTVTGFTMSTLTDGSLMTLGLDQLDYTILAAGCVVVFLISLLQERGVRIRESLGEKPLVLRWAVYGMLVFAIPMFGYVMITTGGFIYAQF
ncbi:MBOAT family O-acyltransferase [Bariatricus sp. SGI.154]|uniref:MBOAT family O-acyltransferase n=1 Tax=Bariatricus sp. SGI.154 TaxID=3420549 RepID=UPI003D068EC3